MNILPKKCIKVATGLYVLVTNHYLPSYFGIRHGSEETVYQASQFLETGTPGTGFYVRTSSSISYRNYVTKYRNKLRINYWKLLCGREFSFRRENIRVRAALRMLEEDKDKVPFSPVKAKILASYLEVLEHAREADLDARIIRGIKDKSHHHHKRLTGFQKGVLASYKSNIDKQASAAHRKMFMVRDYVPQEQYQQFEEVLEAFLKAASSHRIWHVREHADHTDSSYVPVYFDQGIFDYIQVPLMTPMMRDSHDNVYYIYPDFVVKAKSSTRFDMYDIRELTFVYREIPYDMISNRVSHRTKSVQHNKRIHRDYEQFGTGLLVNEEAAAVSIDQMDTSEHIRMRVVGELGIPQLNLRFYSQDAHSMHELVRALKHYKEGLGPMRFAKTPHIG